MEDPNSDLILVPSETSWIASVNILAGMLSSLSSGPIIDFFGRILTLKLCTIPCVIGWALIATATSFWGILIGRVLVGCGCGIGGAATVVYVTEIARPDLRGSLLSCGTMLSSLGLLRLVGNLANVY